MGTGTHVARNLFRKGSYGSGRSEDATNRALLLVIHFVDKFIISVRENSFFQTF